MPAPLHQVYSVLPLIMALQCPTHTSHTSFLNTGLRQTSVWRSSVPIPHTPILLRNLLLPVYTCLYAADPHSFFHIVQGTTT